MFPPAASALLPLRVGAARATRAILTGENDPRARVARRRAGRTWSRRRTRWTRRSIAGSRPTSRRSRPPRCGMPRRPRALASASTCATDAARTRAAILGRSDAHARRGRRHRGVPGEAPPDWTEPVTFDVEIVLRERNYAVTERHRSRHRAARVDRRARRRDGAARDPARDRPGEEPRRDRTVRGAPRFQLDRRADWRAASSSRSRSRAARRSPARSTSSSRRSTA